MKTKENNAWYIGINSTWQKILEVHAWITIWLFCLLVDDYSIFDLVLKVNDS
jgi:hypothetical protein